MPRKSNSKIGTYQEVFDGTKERTKGGLKKDDLVMNKRNKVVSKKRHAIGLKRVDVLSKHRKLKKPKEKISESKTPE